MTDTTLQLVVDDNGDFDRLELGDEVLVSQLVAGETLDIEGELNVRGFTCTTKDLAEFVVPIGAGDEWKHQAEQNLDKWGIQSVETLLLAMQEEMGELTQAHLEARSENGDPDRVGDELVDLGALCYQLAWALDNQNTSTEESDST